MKRIVRVGDLVSPAKDIHRQEWVGIVTHILSASRWTGEPTYTVRWLRSLVGEVDFIFECQREEFIVLSRGAK